MSAQTDCEMLSIEVMEAYAGKYNLSGNKVVELFQKNRKRNSRCFKGIGSISWYLF